MAYGTFSGIPSTSMTTESTQGWAPKSWWTSQCCLELREGACLDSHHNPACPSPVSHPTDLLWSPSKVPLLPGPLPPHHILSAAVQGYLRLPPIIGTQSSVPALSLSSF